MKEFYLMMGTNENEITDNWTRTQVQVSSYAKLEQKMAVKN